MAVGRPSADHPRGPIRAGGPAIDFASDNVAWVEAMHSEPARGRLRAAAPAIRGFMDVLGAWRMRCLPYPLVIDASAYDDMAEAAGALVEAQTAILRLLVREHSHAEVLAMFDLPPSVERLVAWEQLATSRQ